jgi:N-acetylglutamate synthase-like GNAT family acetyltransferase
MKTRKATKADIPVLNRLSDEVHKHISTVSGLPITKAQLKAEHIKSEKELKTDEYYVAEVDGKVIGCIIFGKKIGEDEWKGRYIELHHIIVSKEHQGEGIGKELFKLVKKAALKKKVNIRADTNFENKFAIGFYEKMGFEQFEITLLWRHRNERS